MPPQMYYIWYGAWGNVNNNGTTARPTTVKVLTDMAQSIGGKPWYNTASTYTDSNGPVPNVMKYGGRATVTAKSPCYQVWAFLKGRMNWFKHILARQSPLRDNIPRAGGIVDGSLTIVTSP